MNSIMHSMMKRITSATLLGGTNGNGAVNPSDVSQTKSRSGMTTTNANFRSDVKGKGTLTPQTWALVDRP